MSKISIHISILACALVCASAAEAVDVVLTAPGTLRRAIASPATETSLRVSGPVDASDLYFIAREMPALTVLDLAEVDIVAYRGAAIAGRTGYAAGLIPQNILAGASLSALTLPQSGEVVIGAGAFAGNPLTDIIIGAGVKTVGDGAFLGCAQLRTATVGAADIGAGAFAACTALEQATFTAAGTALGASAFAGDTMLAAVGGSRNINAIGDGAFSGCTALKTFDFSPSLIAVGEAAFLRSGLSSADLSTCTALGSVGAWAFAEAAALTEADMGSAASVGEGVVFMCPALERFTPSTATDSIARYSYAHDRQLLADGLVPEGTRIIGAHAMHGLSQVSTLTLPSTTEKIGDGAMAGMSGLTAITTEAVQVPATGAEVWRGVDQPTVELTVPAGTGADYAAAEQWQRFKIIEYSGIGDITGYRADDTQAIVKGRFDDNELQISAEGAEMTRITLHDASGLRLTAVEPYSSFVTIDTGQLATRIYIVTVSLADGRTTTLKLARR